MSKMMEKETYYLVHNLPLFAPCCRRCCCNGGGCGVVVVIVMVVEGGYGGD